MFVQNILYKHFNMKGFCSMADVVTIKDLEKEINALEKADQNDKEGKDFRDFLQNTLLKTLKETL